MKKIITTLLLGVLIYGNQYAQDETITDSLKIRKNAIGFSFGVPGLGIEYARSLNKHLSLRLRYNALSVEGYEIKDFEINGDITDVVVNSNSQIFDVLFEYQPFKSSSFKLVFGAGYFKEFMITGDIKFEEEQQIGDITLSNEDFGDLNLDADWSGKFAPYLGLGFGRAIPKRRLGLALEIGAYYTGSPEVTLEATRLLSPTEEENQETLQDGFESLNLIPHIKLKLAYSF